MVEHQIRAGLCVLLEGSIRRREYRYVPEHEGVVGHLTSLQQRVELKQQVKQSKLRNTLQQQ